MKGWVKQSLRFLLVTVGIVVLTSFTIDATDTFRGSQTALSIIAEQLTEEGCPLGMVRVADYGFCIDTFEVSASNGCPNREPKNSRDTAQNINELNCHPESSGSILPWTNVTLTQAQALCGKVGKRLPTPLEWYQASLGTPDNARVCNVSGALRAGQDSECRSGANAIDMIGNAWEFVDSIVDTGMVDELSLPEEGYVELVNEAGLPKVTSSTPQMTYNNDYFWSKPNGTYALVRGGFYGSGPDAGIYSAHAAIEQNFSSNAIGFRCAISL